LCNEDLETNIWNSWGFFNRNFENTNFKLIEFLVSRKLGRFFFQTCSILRFCTKSIFWGKNCILYHDSYIRANLHLLVFRWHKQENAFLYCWFLKCVKKFKFVCFYKYLYVGPCLHLIWKFEKKNHFGFCILWIFWKPIDGLYCLPFFSFLFNHHIFCRAHQCPQYSIVAWKHPIENVEWEYRHIYIKIHIYKEHQEECYINIMERKNIWVDGFIHYPLKDQGHFSIKNHSKLPFLLHSSKKKKLFKEYNHNILYLFCLKSCGKIFMKFDYIDWKILVFKVGKKRVLNFIKFVLKNWVESLGIFFQNNHLIFIFLKLFSRSRSKIERNTKSLISLK